MIRFALSDFTSALISDSSMSGGVSSSLIRSVSVTSTGSSQQNERQLSHVPGNVRHVEGRCGSGSSNGSVMAGSTQFPSRSNNAEYGATLVENFTFNNARSVVAKFSEIARALG